MLPNTFHYTQIVEKDGRTFLYDPQFVSVRGGRINALRDTLNEIRECLERFSYPTGEPWSRAVADGGADALCALMVEESDREAKRMKVPQYIANQWRKSLVEDTPRELVNQANALHSQVRFAYEYLPLRNEDIVFVDGKLTVDADAVTDIVVKARALQDNGLHILDVVKQLMGNWLAPSRFPDINDNVVVYTHICIHRHNSREQHEKCRNSVAQSKYSAV